MKFEWSGKQTGNDVDPYEDYSDWQRWLELKMPDGESDKVCEIDSIVLANLYAMFVEFQTKIKQLEAENKRLKNHKKDKIAKLTKRITNLGISY